MVVDFILNRRALSLLHNYWKLFLEVCIRVTQTDSKHTFEPYIYFFNIYTNIWTDGGSEGNSTLKRLIYFSKWKFVLLRNSLNKNNNRYGGYKERRQYSIIPLFYFLLQGSHTYGHPLMYSYHSTYGIHITLPLIFIDGMSCSNLTKKVHWFFFLVKQKKNIICV